MNEKINEIVQEMKASQEAFNHLKKKLPKVIKYFLLLLILSAFFIYITSSLDKESMPKFAQYAAYMLEASPLLIVFCYIVMILRFKVKYFECKMKLKAKFNISKEKLRNLLENKIN